MEFYKLTRESAPFGSIALSENLQSEGIEISNEQLANISGVLNSIKIYSNEKYGLVFRQYMLIYYETGTMEYVHFSETSKLAEVEKLDGFAFTLLEGEEENRVWIGTDGNVENRGPSAMPVRNLLMEMVEIWNDQSN